nr:MAG TPA: hypothetical protein [Caudoviricetes sp.]
MGVKYLLMQLKFLQIALKEFPAQEGHHLILLEMTIHLV